jgi:D-alanyl-D-alanine carboxypeptidase/D-alanyl-D-alanine-endopeptidase (penicillin-binding protein 4)
MRREGVDVQAGGDASPALTAATVAEVASPPVMSLVEEMLTTSDNTLAEYLSRQVQPNAATFQVAAAAVGSSAQAAGVDMTAAQLRDGSGLSPADRVTVRTLVSALQVAARGQDSSWLVLSGLPIAGVTGTLETRYPGVGRGYLRAKTGTLRGVVSLAGTVTTGDGNVLLFAFIANGVSSVPAAQRALDAAATALARCGCN